MMALTKLFNYGLCCICIFTGVWFTFLSSMSPFLISARFKTNEVAVDWSDYDINSVKRSDWLKNEDNNNNVNINRPIIPFILLATQCSGSTWFLRKLGLHEDVFVHNYEPIPFDSLHSIGDVVGGMVGIEPTWEEYKNELDSIFYNVIARARGAKEENQFKLTKKGINGYLAVDPKPNAKAFGIKIMYSQVPQSLRKLFANYLYVNNITVIHLMRESLLEMFVSQILMKGEDKEKGYETHEVLDEEEAMNRPSNQQSYYVNPSALQSYINMQKSEKNIFQQILIYFPWSIPYLEVNIFFYLCYIIIIINIML